MSALSSRGRAVRLAVTTAGLGLLLAGTVAGSDDDFPFGPFRMYATADSRGGEVVSTAIEVRSGIGPFGPAPLTPETTGLRRAEVEGQLARLVADPALLRLVAVAHSRRQPSAPAWTGVRVVQTRYQLRNGAPVGERRVVLAEWSAEGAR